MKCKECSSIMVVENPGMINTGSTPSWWMKCKCGNRDLEYGTPPTQYESFEERWAKAQRPKNDPLYPSTDTHPPY